MSFVRSLRAILAMNIATITRSANHVVQAYSRGSDSYENTAPRNAIAILDGLLFPPRMLSEDMLQVACL